MEYKSLLSGQTYVIEKQIGGGGEGRIFTVASRADRVVKLYDPPLCTPYREEKLKTMLAIPLSSDVDVQLAWPKDLLYDGAGRFAGFAMRRISEAVPLSTLLCRDCKEIDFQMRVRLARNLCALVYSIHSAGLVIGDLNANNLLVTEGLLRMIDTDSFHLHIKNKTFRCSVCVPENLDPRVARALSQGQTLKTAPLPTFSRDSDLYALVVVLFQLLFDGTHPFAVALARGNKREDVPTPTELMRKYLFPYEDSLVGTGLSLPVYALPYRKMLTKRLCTLFADCFSRGRVIEAEAWYAALGELLGELTGVCKRDPTHKFRGDLHACPYCKTARRMQAYFEKRQK